MIASFTSSPIYPKCQRTPLKTKNPQTFKSEGFAFLSKTLLQNTQSGVISTRYCQGFHSNIIPITIHVSFKIFFFCIPDGSRTHYVGVKIQCLNHSGSGDITLLGFSCFRINIFCLSNHSCKNTKSFSICKQGTVFLHFFYSSTFSQNSYLHLAKFLLP